mgnify:CR=1 FL=1
MISALRNLQDRVALMIGRAVLRAVNDGAKMQEVQVEILAGELRNVERFQDYGLTSAPLPGAEAVTGSVGGDRSHTIALRVDDRRHRLRGLSPGEVALYTDEGDIIKLKRGRVVEITAGAAVNINAPAVTVSANAVTLDAATVAVTGNLTVEGSAAVVGAVTGATVGAGGIDLAGHTHSGVRTGTGNTGAAQ